mgnify:CR=1 FL=1
MIITGLMDKIFSSGILVMVLTNTVDLLMTSTAVLLGKTTIVLETRLLGMMILVTSLG